VGRGRSSYAYQIDVIPGDKVLPIISYVFDAELSRDTLGVFATPAGNCDYLRALAIAKAGNLGGAREAGAHNADADSSTASQFLLIPQLKREH
jgi:hypothetical protein